MDVRAHRDADEKLSVMFSLPHIRIQKKNPEVARTLALIKYALSRVGTRLF